MKPKIKIRIEYYPGYGTPPAWEVFAIWENVLLDSKVCGSELEAGRTEAAFRTKWGKTWRSLKWREAIRNKKPASPLCCHCGKDTQNGCILCVEKIFCKDCEPHIEQYKKEYQEQIDKIRAEIDARNARIETERRAKVDLEISGAFHWRDNWFFKRLPDGSAMLTHFQSDGHYLLPHLVIPLDEMASILCSLSRSGETAEKWEAAREFLRT